MCTRYQFGAEVGRIEATDADGDVISYSLIGGDTAKYFILNSGMLHVAQSLTGLNDARDDLVVLATDSGTPRRSTNVTVCLLLSIVCVIFCF